MKTSGVGGQAPRDYQEFLQLLVKQGNDSISSRPDRIITATVAALVWECNRVG